MAGSRLDQALAQLFPDFSRSRLTAWLKQGLVTVDDEICKPKEKVTGGEQVLLQVADTPETAIEPQNIPLNIVHQDEHLLVINKPAGLVVHPGAGNHNGTMLNGLLFHFPEQKRLPRGGIVHRLDKDTTGLMVVALSELAHKSLVEQLQSRTMGREYQAVVQGVLTGGGCVDEPIGRHPTARTKMAVHPMGKPAVTHYRVAERFAAHSLLDIKLETGRTHQIRVHMAHLHHPLVGDPVYAGRARIPAGVSETVKKAVREFHRQALHARKLSLIHPASGQEMIWEVPMPDDMQHLVEVLKSDCHLD
jgi:23S rRNA pseudouridine1911/1915/1917 synthase